MNSQFGKNFRISLFGESHGAAIGAVIEGIPAGLELDSAFIASELKRRQGGTTLTTPRKEADEPLILSGANGTVASGAPLAVVINNSNTNSASYDKIKDLVRPGHADYTAYIKYGGNMDMTGGGPFSARFTAAYVFCGAIAKLILKNKGITVTATLESVGSLAATDKDFDSKLEKLIAELRENDDSVGGIINCQINNLPAGVGEPHFRGIENVISQAVFAVPAVKGIEFGGGFSLSAKNASTTNDAYPLTTNNSGGVLGGIANGMPVTFRVALKPTPSIAKSQNTINIKTNQPEIISVTGRHDPCVAIRAVPVIEAAAACAIADLLGDFK